jgi:hypothetical protein
MLSQERRCQLSPTGAPYAGGVTGPDSVVTRPGATQASPPIFPAAPVPTRGVGIVAECP